MNLNIDDTALVAAARSGERGAFRALAVRLDERLGNEDAFLDGAVMAWGAIQGPGRRAQRAVTATPRYLSWLRRHFAGPQLGDASAMTLTHEERAAASAPALDRRPAA